MAIKQVTQKQIAPSDIKDARAIDGLNIRAVSETLGMYEYERVAWHLLDIAQQRGKWCLVEEGHLEALVSEESKVIRNQPGNQSTVIYECSGNWRGKHGLFNQMLRSGLLISHKSQQGILTGSYFPERMKFYELSERAINQIAEKYPRE